ncbi:hypothetical protein KGF56_000549 [Candida oxycetoniae]|uniref:Elongator complex protein 5 n=1 Tax=Candida oxycetoniae TaxID=497107 RepID=A0AAI9T0P9_9ASCO|nr:uncharacterized protein KGF56_000549 [Candida oxycetoniae]KAI3406703.1 hypothetical protein KGF56_000549 [Candida oxycetoniae]
MSSQNAAVLLTRLLSLRESSSFHLVLDSLTQSSYYLVREYIHHQYGHQHANEVIYLSFETGNRPQWATEFVDCTVESQKDAVQFVKTYINSLSAASRSSKILIIVDSLNHLPNEHVIQFVTGLVAPNAVVVATYHTSCVEPFVKYTNYPSTISLLTYFASTIFEVEPIFNSSVVDDEETLERQVAKLNFPANANLNSQVFKLVLTNRRRSGRSIVYKFTIDCKRHSYELLKEKEEENYKEDEESLLKDLTTFNLTTSSKEKLAREQVELPFMQAQEALGSTAGGAIVYEFEKDDDYDEEDPYEDPF